jgi:hypothetical protein
MKPNLGVFGARSALIGFIMFLGPKGLFRVLFHEFLFQKGSEIGDQVEHFVCFLFWWELVVSPTFGDLVTDCDEVVEYVGELSY